MAKWLPWKFITKYVAQSQGFIDPINVYARLQNFAQPSEVAEPIELLRAGVIMHARGLINSRAIQHNLDWVWPYWVEKQFNPLDASFVPRAFSITHINLTHRNWSAIGLPGFDEIPIVDPRGLVTPFWDSWSLDAWFIPHDGDIFLPSRRLKCEQSLETSEGVAIKTHFDEEQITLTSNAYVENSATGPELTIDVSLLCDKPGWLVVGVRPYNPEGISFVDSINLHDDRKGWLVNGKNKVTFNREADRHHSSNYTDGDVYIHLKDMQDDTGATCSVGLATSAAMFDATAEERCDVTVKVPLIDNNGVSRRKAKSATKSAQNKTSWQQALEEESNLKIPNQKFVNLYEAAIRSLILCTPSEIYAGPFTYKRFWYRDAVYIAHGLLSAGLVSRTEAIIRRLPDGQKKNGYFHSQDGEWDSNGQVLWIYKRYCEVRNNGQHLYEWDIVQRAANWIINKRLPDNDSAEWPGLMPAGFSAEHLGPNDYYYWDNYWSVAGLEAAAWLAGYYDKTDEQLAYTRHAESFRASIEKSLRKNESQRKSIAVPAAPGRRMDAGAIGSLVASYPLQHYPPDDTPMLESIEFLLKNCFVNNGFFQDMIHSGVNAYLSLHVAQALLRAGDERFYPIVEAIADLASPTGHWPEAIHPITGGGCMGDGHHAWAAAEWIAMTRSLFVREEGDGVVLCSGISPDWLKDGSICSFGPTPTAFGTITVTVEAAGSLGVSTNNKSESSAPNNKLKVTWDANWHSTQPAITINIPGYVACFIDESNQREALVQKDYRGA